MLGWLGWLGWLGLLGLYLYPFKPLGLGLPSLILGRDSVDRRGGNFRTLTLLQWELTLSRYIYVLYWSPPRIVPVVYEPVQKDGHSYARRRRVERMCRMVMMVRPPRWRRMEMVWMVPPE